MSKGPKAVEEQLRNMVNAWKEMAADKKFAVTLDEFKAGIKPSFDVRDKLAALEDQMTKAMNDRDNFDEASMALAQRVINAVLADDTEGKDSPSARRLRSRPAEQTQVRPDQEEGGRRRYAAGVILPLRWERVGVRA